MIKKFMQGLVRAELEEQASANLKTGLIVYGAIGAAGALFGVGAAIKSFVDRVGALEHRMELLDRVIAEEEKKVEAERRLVEARDLLARIDGAKRLTAEHEAKQKDMWAERDVIENLVRQRIARSGH